ncbi:MAG TPA: tyrosine-type recombinase/integrase [Candidatus Limnocylindria bacterium]|nr:tyrosine-type recombinase/integrase [Candidatus Limnocylindria bacterium]
MPVATERLAVGAYLERWVEGVRANVRPTTHVRYAALLRRHLMPRLGRIALTKLQPTDLTTAYAAMIAGGLAPLTVGQAHRVLGTALRDAERSGLVARNVQRLVRPPRAEHRDMDTLTAEQARTLIVAAASDRLGALYALALDTGAREGELLALRWTDVDFEAGAIHIVRTLQRLPGRLLFADPKTAASRRAIPLGARALDALRRHRVAQAEERLRVGAAWTDSGLVFTTEVGTPIDAGNLLRRTHYPLLARAGLPRVRFHDLRHTAATLLLTAGTHPSVVAERLGHSTPSLTLNVYSHVTPTMQKEAAATLDAMLGA